MKTTIATDQCRSCHAPILWLVNTTTQKRAPIDAEPTPDGNILVMGNGTYRVLKANERDDPPEGSYTRHTNHFQTCPDAAKFAGGKR